MRPLAEQNHYELLEVAPAATAKELEAAFAKAKAYYGPDSVAIYTLVSPEEAQALVLRIEEAFRVLSDAQSRASYDASLGLAPAAPVAVSPPKAKTAWLGSSPYDDDEEVLPPAPPPPPPLSVMPPPPPSAGLEADEPKPKPRRARRASKKAQVELPLAQAGPDLRLVEAVPEKRPEVVEPPKQAEAVPAPPELRVEDVEEPRPVFEPETAKPAEEASVPGWIAGPVEEPKPAVEAAPEPPQPVVEEPKPLVEVAPEPPPPVVDPKPLVEVAPEPPPPAVEEPKPAVESDPKTPRPVVEEPRPAVEVAPEPPKPLVEAPKPLVEKPDPQVEAPTLLEAPRLAEVAPEPPKPVARPVVVDLVPEPTEPLPVPTALVRTNVALARTRDPEKREGPPSKPTSKFVEIPPDAVFTGELLRRVREGKNLSVKELSDRTKISLVHVQNIEADRYSALPVTVYLRGFLMSMARELKLDPLKVSKSYLELAAKAKQKG